MRYFLIALSFMFFTGCTTTSGYFTFQECFDDFVDFEGFSPRDAIAECTLDQDIDGEILVFLTVGECISYVDAELTLDSATDLEIEDGCEDYFDAGGN